MWNSLFDQIQQRLDDAADLLGDEEGEEVEELERESVSHDAGGQPRTEPAEKPSAPTAAIGDARRSSDMTGVDDEAQGWDDEDLDSLPHLPPVEVTPSMIVHEKAPVQAAQAAIANAAESPATALNLSTNLTTSTNTEETLGGAFNDEVETEAVVNTSISLHESSEETPVVAAATATAIATVAAQLATPPTFPTVEVLPALPPSVAASDAGPSALLPLAQKANFDSGVVPATSVVVAPSVGQLEETGATETPEVCERSVQDVSASPHLDLTAESRTQLLKPTSPKPGATPPPPPRPAKESGDVAQLLRFQQQLAEEMENVASLQRENSALKRRASVLEGELASATARLANAAGSEMQISLLIEKLGKEKERHRAAASERGELEEHVQDLEEELEDYRVREQGWISGSEQLKQNESAAQQRIAQLEKEVRTRDSLIEDLNARLRETAHQHGVLQHQLEELKASYSFQMSSVKESNSDTVDQLRHEVEQLRSSLHNLSTEYDTRTAELEREVQQSNARAHQAEARFSEAEFGSVHMLQDLRSELEDSQRSIAAWKAESQKARGEYTELLDQYALLKRSRAASDADLRERLAAESASMAELRKKIREWEDRYQALQGALRAAQDESEDQRKTIMALEAANQKLKVATADGFIRSQSDASLASPVPPKRSSLDTSFSALSFSNRPLGRAAMTGVPLNPFADKERPPWGDSTDRKTRERLEQEVLRQSAELERLRQAASEGAEWKDRLLQLQTEHDWLLQLYGQLEDEVGALKSKTTTASAAVSAANATVSSSTPP